MERKETKMADNTLMTDSLLSIGQIRLAELSVYNWGSFNGLHTASIDPKGTLVTGGNGAGKSTLIDGLMALLLPPGKATFNVAAAQNDRSDRSLLSYMRGSYGSLHDGAGTRVKSKREAAVVTGLRALYEGDDGSKITLATLFWTTQSTNALADVKRVYVVAKRNMVLKEMLDAFGEGNARALKQWLRDDPAITCCDDNFSVYQELYRKILHMDNRNAPALLSRALGLKKIDDLTGLIRELVLEPSTVKDDARKVVDEYTDLVAIHNKLLDARAQKEHLSRLPELGAAIENVTAELDKLASEKSSLPVYFGEVFAKLWGEKIAGIEAELSALALKIKQTEKQESDATEDIERRHEEYLQLGGDRIESLKKDIGNTKVILDRVIRDSSSYQKDAKGLELNSLLDEEVFLKNQSNAVSSLNNLQSDNELAQNQFGQIAGELSVLQQQNTSIENEILEIEARPDSNIDVKFQQLRDELVGSLGLQKEQCIFIGELIDVKDEERQWQGAIERALGGLRTTMAVPSDCYPMVTRWLNARYTGLHVRVQVVNKALANNRPEFKENGYLRKLVWRNHPYREWLKNHLQRFDLQCVASTEELDRTPFSITQQGLMHMEKGRFEKKDQYRIDDRRRWCLGFSNKSRLALLNNDKMELTERLAETEKLVKKARQDMDLISRRKELMEKIQTYRWDDINAPYWQGKYAKFQSDLAELEQSGGDLGKAKSRWESAKSQLAEIKKELKQFVSDEGGCKTSLQKAKEEYARAQVDASKGLLDSTRELLSARIGILTTDDTGRMLQLMQKVEKDLDLLLEDWRNRKGKAVNISIGIMSSFRSHEKWQVLAIDWQCDIGSLTDYLEHLRQLENEGLPDLVEQFVERLNKHATQSLARIKTKLDSDKEDILERLDTINRVLSRTEFRRGSYLKLGPKMEKFPHVQAFEQDLRKVLSQVTSEDHEARFQQLEKVVQTLEKASAPGTSSNQESLRLLDPRYQMSFYAEERDTNSGEVLDVLQSSSGKSGGEKESFAGTIVAASLAYVLTPDGCDRPVCCTVFLDEAFSNTAEAVSRRVLRVFKELHIHVNLITPYKNLNLARESARSLLIVEIDQGKHDSHLCEITWDEIDQRLREEKEKKLMAEASRLGVEMGTQLADEALCN
jgi:uncharacterized protein YPO0396